MEHLDGPSEQPAGRRRGVRSSILAAGAVFGVTLAGLGLAGAQTPSSTPETAPSSPTVTEDVVRDRGMGPHGRGGAWHGAHLALDVAATTIGVTEADLLTARRGGQSIAQVAQSKNVAVQKVVDALVAEAKTRLAAKVTAGELTQAQADERAADLVARMTEVVNRAGGLGGPGPHGRRGPDAKGDHLAAAAKAIGITEAELVTALRGGQSIAQVAQSKNVPVQKVIDAMVAEAQTNLVERITELVNRTGR